MAADDPKQRQSMSPARDKENIIRIPGKTSKAAGGVGPRSGKKTPTPRQLIPSASSPPASRLGLATSNTPADRSKLTSSSTTEPIRQAGGGGVSRDVASTHASRGQKGRDARSRTIPESVGKRSVRKIRLSTPVSEPSGRALPRRKGEGKTGRGGVRNSAHDARRVTVTRANKRLGKGRPKSDEVAATGRGGVRNSAHDARRVTVTRANKRLGKGRPKSDEVAATARGLSKHTSHPDGDASGVFSFDVGLEDDDEPRELLQNDGEIDEQRSIKGASQAFLSRVAANGSQVPRRRSSNADGRREETASVSRKGGALVGVDAKRSARTNKRKITVSGAGVRKTVFSGAATSAVAKLPSKQDDGDDPRVLLAIPEAAEPLAVSPRTNDPSLLRHAEPSRGWGQLRALFGDSDEEDEWKSRTAALWRLSDEEDSVDMEAERRARSVRKSMGTTEGGRGSGRSLRRARDGKRRSTGSVPDERIKQGKGVKGCGDAPAGRNAFVAPGGRQRRDGGHRDGAGGEVGVGSSTAAGPEVKAASPSEREGTRGRRSDWKGMSKTDQKQLEALAAYYREVDSFPLHVSS